MADKRRFFDVWIIEANTVYREVPYEAVADWVQQGRLLEDDMLRPSGTAEWQRLGGYKEFKVYVPKPQAEPEPPSAVEPMEEVETGFTWKRRSELEETEVDMIPLIDVSLVLLIFFMLTLQNASSGAPVPTPPASHGVVANATPDAVWVGINIEGPDRTLVYSCGYGGLPARDEDRQLSREDMLRHLLFLLAGAQTMQQPAAPKPDDDKQAPPPTVDLTIDANPQVPSGEVRRLTAALSDPPYRPYIRAMYTGVSDKKQ